MEVRIVTKNFGEKIYENVKKVTITKMVTVTENGNEEFSKNYQILYFNTNNDLSEAYFDAKGVDEFAFDFLERKKK